MIEIKNEGVILRGEYGFEKNGVFNPSCVSVGDEVWMYYRAVDKNKISSIGFCRLKKNEVVERFDQPILVPEHYYEKSGIEDPRITKIDETYYLFYCAYDGVNARIAYATTKKLPHFVKQGLIMPDLTYKEAGELLKKNKSLSSKYAAFEQIYEHNRGENVLLWEKDAFLFPEKTDGKFTLCHRVLPGIQIVFFKDFSELTADFWQKYFSRLEDYDVIEPSFEYDSWNVGGGCPPLKTAAGWLLIYHTVENVPETGRVYHASAALLDLDNPLRVIARLDKPLFSPTSKYEKEGVVDNVVFPTSALVENGRLYIYYGGGDNVIALKSIDLDLLIETLLKNQSNQKTTT
ncbi:pesticidal protein Cry7Aa [Candidatus Berkelbacteria bacterium CG10_big_fil_rev_8_21_14_0_10_43_13]|uniref:Pesticidal protein Cry7Aa n=1 Tax=Candidatus Berkelbacteria bacterium CG10_big_fil_rev_8_21_14_0_10_43_13 TaxID=1974514 RepID=A0A2H0W6I4_9BACT|nr:MAG: pesticidal protein Cry7Aa [Candidatus Berkelbacteria bacterium CG10_big_fil_rev_8_21_14_0_10_43_13]